MTNFIVHVVDDDEDVRVSLELLLRTQGLTTAGYASAQAFLDEYDAALPGCLLLDVRMPEIDGLGLQQALIERGVRIPIIFMSGHGNIPTSVKALRAGAIDFLEKPFDKSVLLERIAEAREQDERQRKVISDRLGILERYRTLTPREREVMGQVVSGKSNKEIAKVLAISHRTVELHRTRMMAKMQAGSLPDLVGMAMICGVHEIDGLVLR